MIKKIALLSAFLFSNLANAYYVASDKSTIDPDIATHIIVTGMPEKLGNLFFLSAKTKIKLIKELYPNEQIILIGSSDDISYAKNAKDLTIIETSPMLLKSSVVKNYANKVKKIKSIDLYAHSNALEGVIIDKNILVGHAISEKDDLWDVVSEKITNESYIMIHGCNAGVKMAPTLAMKLKIAVFGALTSSDIQQVYNDSTWAFDYDNQNLSLNKEDNRTRMRPVNSSYKGHWGDWTEGGYPTYKVFCGNLSDKECAPSAYQAILTFPSITKNGTQLNKEEFKRNLIDFMCPVSTFRSTFKDCESALNSPNKNATYSPFRGNTLNCTKEKCAAHFKCNSLTIALNPSGCKLINEDKNTSTTFVDDYLFLLSTFDSAQGK